MGDTSKIRVAILGGDLAGILVLRGLLRYPHIVVDIYDSESSFSKEGLAFEFPYTVQKALYAIDPSLNQCLDRAGAVSESMEAYHASGGYTESGGARYPPDLYVPNSIVGRPELLSQLTADLPRRAVHLNARVTSIRDDNGGEGVVLVFANGSQERYDVLVGSDGTDGLSRKYVLGVDNPKLQLEHTGFWSLHLRVPLARAQEAIGTEFLDPSKPKQVRWVGDGIFMQHNLLNDGRDVQVTVYAQLDPAPIDPKSRGGPATPLLTPDELESSMALLEPGDFEGVFSTLKSEACKGIVKLFRSVFTVQIIGPLERRDQLVTSPPFSLRHATRNACLVGCAACPAPLSPHGSTAATTLAVEQALALTRLLGRADSKVKVSTALRTYDRFWGSRSESLMQNAFVASHFLAGRGAYFTELDASSQGENGHTAVLLSEEGFCEFIETLEHEEQALRMFVLETKTEEAFGFMDQLLAEQALS
ncbi:hypothetical protein DL763_006578 [Monosporascus cannonballus]|nr:hypothetical protein DL763_006578 [Monosporascus cannonballus]